MLTRTISKLTTKLVLFIGTSLALVAGGVVTFVSHSASFYAPAQVKLQTNRQDIRFSAAHSLAAGSAEQATARALALAAADFDEDGTPDLLGSSTDGSTGSISFYRGNVEAILPTSKTAPNAAAFFPASNELALPLAPEFLVTGDFNADGHFDVVAAARNRSTLALLAGDGNGNFAALQTLELSGNVTALAAGEINRADGLADLAVAINAPNGAQALLFAAAEGAWTAQPQTFELAHEATSFAFGHLTRDAFADLAIAAGSELALLEGGAPTPTMTRKAMQFAIDSVAIGRFTDTARNQIAMLARGGSIYVAQDNRATNPRGRRGSKTRNQDWRTELLLDAGTQPEAAGTRQLLRAQVSTNAKDDLLWLAADQLQIVTNKFTPELAAVKAESQAEIVAALPMRVSPSAVNGLVLLSAKHAAPLVAQPEVAMTFTVNNTSDFGDLFPGDGVCSFSQTGGANTCTLRAAIQEANANVGLDTINFNINAGPQTITIGTPLPIIGAPVTVGGVVISGETLRLDGVPQAGAPADQSITITYTVPPTAPPPTPAAALNLLSSGNTVRGLTIRGINFNAGINLSGSNNNIIEGNTIFSISGSGVSFNNSSNNTIGGTTAAARNIIYENYTGIELNQITTTQNTIVGNYIGTNSTGTIAMGNFTGIAINFAENNTIGGTTAGARNIISGNDDEGISITGAMVGKPLTGQPSGSISLPGQMPEAANNNTIQGNYIGVDATGVNPLGNGISSEFSPRGGIRIFGANGTIIRGNVIANNSGNGVFVEPMLSPSPDAVNNSIQDNSIHSNSGLGIELGAAGVTPNDAGDADAGANNLQNFPVLTSALSRTTGTTISGTLNSAANSSYTIELFSNAACDASGNGEGETFVTRLAVTTDAAGNATFSTVVTPPLAAGRALTATATDLNGNTSEFSACVAVQNAVADLAVTKTATPNPVFVGNNLTYNLTVSNAGPNDATGVVLTDTIAIPGGQFTIVSATTPKPGGSCSTSGSTITCSLGSFAPGASTTVTIVIAPTIPTGPTIPPNSVTATNTATVTGIEVDSNLLNNTVTVTSTVSASADLAVTQTVSVNPAQSGQVVTYSITVTNNGPSVAATATANITLPPQLTNITCTAAPGWICSGTGNVWATSFPSMGPGSATTTLRGTLACLTQDTTLTSTATVSGQSFDPNAANNTSTLNSTGLVGAALGAIAYDAGGTALSFGPVVAGSTATPPSGTFTLTNTGCLPMNLTTALFRRASDTATLAGVDDSRYYSLRLVPATGAEIPLPRVDNPDRNGTHLIPINRTLLSGEQLRFRVSFNPPLPFFAGFFAQKDQQLFASQVLPGLLNSMLTFNFIAGSVAGTPGSATADMTARVSPAVQIIPREGFTTGTQLVNMDTIFGDFRVRVSLFDANKNVNRITYQFFDTFRQPAGNPLEVNLATAISQSALLPGQCFTLQQDFSGAGARPDIVYVRVTVTDADGTSVSASSSPFIPTLTATSAFTPEAVRGDVITLPALRWGTVSDARRRQTDSRSIKDVTKREN
jgi:uncharacterized repeat protein (TIGR01451 family)